MENGLPRVLKWHSTKAPEKKFIIRYGYNQSPDLTYFPRSMEISLDMGKEEMVVGAYKILFLKTTSAPLDSSYFDHKRYYTSDSSPMTKTFVFTNGELYGLRGGRLESVLPMSQMDLKGPLEKRKYIKTVRTAVWAFIGASIVGVLLLAVRFSKQKNNEGKQ
jgi:hypothetical protein